MASIQSNIFGLAGRSVTVPVDSLWAPREEEGPVVSFEPAAPAIHPGRPLWADHELIAHGDGVAAIDLALLLGEQGDARPEPVVTRIAAEDTIAAPEVPIAEASAQAMNVEQVDFVQLPLAAFQAADDARIDPHETFTMFLPEQVAMDSGMFMIV